MLHLYKIHSQSRLFFCFQRIHLFINIGNTNHGSLEQLLVVELMLFPAPITCYLMLSPEVTLFSFPLSSLELYLQTNYSSISSFGILGTYVAVLSVDRILLLVFSELCAFKIQGLPLSIPESQALKFYFFLSLALDFGIICNYCLSPATNSGS